MTLMQLESHISIPEIHRKILQNYTGAYALGVTRLNAESNEGAFHLHVTGETLAEFPNQVEIDGEDVPVLVNRNWTPPTTQAHD